MSYALCALGYECPSVYETKKEAREEMTKFMEIDKAFSKYKLCAVMHTKDHKELKIGSKQGYHTYSEYWITKV